MRTFAVAAMITLATAAAAAHGLPPMTNGIYFAADDPNSLYVASTFGLLVSHDGGCTMYWVCEAKVGYRDPDQPKYAVARDGTIFAATHAGLRVSRDGGCSFTTATAELPAGDPDRIADRFVDVVAIGATGDVWVGIDDGGPDNDVFVSHDNGLTFAPVGLLSPTVRWTSLVAAPGDATRTYALGQNGTAVHLMRRDGAAWTEASMTGVQLAPSPIVTIAAVDPTNRDLVYVISTLIAGDQLYRSTDGGMTFAEVLAPTEGWIHDVVVRDAHVFVTTMVPAGSITVGGPAYGSSDGGASFAPLAGAPSLQCLGVAPDGSLVGCGHNWEPDFMAVTRSSDGAAWQKVWRFVELEGALACPAETDVGCEQTGSDVINMFAATGPTCGAHVVDAGPDMMEPGPPPRPPGCCDAGDPPSLVWAIGVAGFLVRRRRRGANRRDLDT